MNENLRIIRLIWLDSHISMDEMQFLDSVYELAVSYLDDERPLVDYQNFESLERITDTNLQHGPMPYEQILLDIQHYLKYCVKTNQSGFMNPLWGGISTVALASELITSLTNTSMYTFELAPIGTVIEKSIISKMLGYVGYPDGAGTFTTGGSNGNMLGMLCARLKHNPMGMHTGYDNRNLVALVSEESHYSVVMAGNVIGIGKENIISIKSDSHGRMRADALADEIQHLRAEGKDVFCVIATSGTTVKGSFDPLKELAEVCFRENIWLHVDAAWGGSALLSSKHTHLMDGVELADSVCWDAHKMMGIPLICSSFLVKDESILAKVCNHTKSAHYLFQSEDRTNDLGHYSLQCGRRNDALKLFLAWRQKGDEGWSKLIDAYMELADYVESKISLHTRLELVSPREWTNICFRYTSEIIDQNALNKELRKRLMQNGNFMVSKAMIDGMYIIRLVISNPEITTSSLDNFIEEVVRIGEEIENELPHK